MELSALFQEAVANSKLLKEKPDNEILLQIYSLYKQATVGDCKDTPIANPFDFVAKFKQEAWMQLKGMSSTAAMEAYVELINRLRN